MPFERRNWLGLVAYLALTDVKNMTTGIPDGTHKRLRRTNRSFGWYESIRAGSVAFASAWLAGAGGAPSATPRPSRRAERVGAERCRGDAKPEASAVFASDRRLSLRTQMCYTTTGIPDGTHKRLRRTNRSLGWYESAFAPGPSPSPVLLARLAGAGGEPSATRPALPYATLRRLSLSRLRSPRWSARRHLLGRKLEVGDGPRQDLEDCDSVGVRTRVHPDPTAMERSPSRHCVGDVCFRRYPSKVWQPFAECRRRPEGCQGDVVDERQPPLRQSPG